METRGESRTVYTSSEDVWENESWSKTVPRLSVAIPTYRDDASSLISALAACAQSESIEVVVFDDGSFEPDDAEAQAFGARLRNVAEDVACAVCVIRASRHVGRSAARNRLVAHARANWVLLLDADMKPDESSFLTAYFDAIDSVDGPCLVVGGFSLKFVEPSKDTALHYWQANRSECEPARVRNTDPGRYVFTSNVLAHREILETIPFDEQFSGWGWEDVEWGVRVSENARVHHIENTATHLGLDSAEALLRKYRRSGPNFARLAERHPGIAATPLYRAAKRLHRFPFRKLLIKLMEPVARHGFGILPLGARGRAMKLWRAAVYAENLR